MTTKLHRAFYCVIFVAVLPPTAHAINPAQWTLKEQILNTDTSVTWYSPTTIDLGKMVWEYEYEIVKVTGTVNIPILGDFTQDITSSIAPELRTGGGETSDLPAIIVMDQVTYADTGTSADIFIEVDSAGFGHAEFSDISLGSINVPIAGNRPIRRMNIEANITVRGFDFGDFNRDGAVNGADYVTSRKGDGSLADYDVWRGRFGAISGAATQMGTAVPEPASALLLLCGTVLGMASGRTLSVNSKGRKSIRVKKRYS